LRYPVFIAVIGSLACILNASVSDKHNILTPTEKAQGWILLFDGHSFDHWRNPEHLNPPGDAWTIEDGCLKATAHPHITEDLISAGTYHDFEMQWDWRISPAGNSGVKYEIQALPVLTPAITGKRFEDRVNQALTQHLFNRDAIPPSGRSQIYVVGFEYQMIDNGHHPDALRGPLYQSGALYGIVPPIRDVTRPVGEFNHSRLVVRGRHVEHWLNGVKVVDVTINRDLLRHTLGKRWGVDSPVFHLLADQPKHDAPISLQNHDDVAWFRDIKIKPL
jgi:3-keto-disaccharide hydrolase